MDSSYRDIYDLSQLRTLPLEERLAGAHPFLRQVVVLAQETSKPQSILVFGSRARGDHRKNSDFDIAFKGVKDESGWALMVTSLMENAETLCSFDLLRFEELASSLQASIDREGILIYEYPSST